MLNSEETFEHIDAQVKKLNLNNFEKGGTHHFTAETVATNPASVLQSICSIYKGIRGIISAVASLPFLPGAWKTAIKTFISLMDNLCP